MNGRPIDNEHPMERAITLKLVIPGYHEALGVPLKRGRLLREADGPDAVVINETAARKFFGAEDPVSRLDTALWLPALAGRMRVPLNLRRV